jgi:NAD(P)-dependent dehydrogenase (short-subunit alcohol dehydrogenase family)
MRATSLLAAGLGTAALARWRPWDHAKLGGSVVLITGGSRGLGLLLAREFGAAGARLALCARNVSELARARDELASRGYEVFAMRADVSDRQEARLFVEQTVAHFGQLDMIVNNAGIIQVGPAQAMTPSDFHDAVGAIFWGTCNVTTAATPYLRRSASPRIVNITSIGGVVAVPHMLPYSAAKFATVGYSMGLAAELASEGIRVVTIVPGLMRTGSHVNALVKGRRTAEAGWFSLSASAPLLSMDGERAARRIVSAARRGVPFAVIGLPAKLLRMASALAPGLTTDVLGFVARLMPSAARGPEAEATRAGDHLEGAGTSSLTALGDRAALRNNEMQVPPREQLH